MEQKKGIKPRLIPGNFILAWVEQARKENQTGFLIVTDGEKYFAHYAFPDEQLWDTAVKLENMGYHVEDFLIFGESETTNVT